MPVDLHKLLTQTRTIAIIGCSNRSYRTSHHAAKYLLSAGYSIVPVNPNYETVLGLKCYPDLSDLPGEMAIDIVNVFRRPEAALATVQSVVRWQKATGQSPVVWTQLGVSTDDAMTEAKQAGLAYVENRCIMTEHSRMATGVQRPESDSDFSL